MNSLRFAFLFSTLIALSAPAAHAEDASTPVKEILGAAMNRSAETPVDDDYFSEDRLDRIYSKSFAATYRAAWKKQESADNGGYLLDADPITFSQDGCPLKDLSLKTMDERDGWTPVGARFKAFYCLDEVYNPKESITQFVVLKEDGHFVIDDIQKIAEGKVAESIKSQLENLSK